MFQFRFPKRRPVDIDAPALIREASLLLPSPARRRFLTGAVGLAPSPCSPAAPSRMASRRKMRCA